MAGASPLLQRRVPFFCRLCQSAPDPHRDSVQTQSNKPLTARQRPLPLADCVPRGDLCDQQRHPALRHQDDAGRCQRPVGATELRSMPPLLLLMLLLLLEWLLLLPDSGMRAVVCSAPPNRPRLDRVLPSHLQQPHAAVHHMCLPRAGIVPQGVPQRAAPGHHRAGVAAGRQPDVARVRRQALELDRSGAAVLRRTCGASHAPIRAPLLCSGCPLARALRPCWSIFGRSC